MGDWKRHLPIVALITSVIGIALFDINVIAHGALDHDEIEHAHVAWLMSLGHLPYRDFNQNHMPATWLSTAQLFDGETHTIMPLLTARALCCLAFVVAAAIGLWMLQATDPQTSASERWLFMAVAMLLMVFVQFFRLRPDPFMTLATTGAVACCCRLLEAPRRWACIFGVSMGIAAMFSTKIVAFCLLVPIFSVTYAVERQALATVNLEFVGVGWIPRRCVPRVGVAQPPSVVGETFCTRQSTITPHWSLLPDAFFCWLSPQP